MQHNFYAQRYTLNGVTAYCIEPGVLINTNIYSSTSDFSMTNLSEDTLNYIKLVAYYGYDYPGHENMNYYFASQAMIWKKITGNDTTWYHIVNYSSQFYDVSEETNEIENLIRRHYITPSFTNDTIYLTIDEETTINDENNILSEYEIHESNYQNISIENNSLKIKLNTIGELGQVKLKRKSYTNSIPLLYYNSSNQKLISRGNINDNYISFNTDVNTGTIYLNKFDKETGTIPQGDGSLLNAKYDIIDSEDNVVDTLITGIKNRSTYLKYGKYTIKETEPSQGYNLDETVYQVTLDKNNTDIIIDVYEDIIKGSFSIHKVYATNETGEMVGEPNATFEIYLKSAKELYKTITTDDNGYVTITLPYGTYIVRQTEATENYEKIEDFEITIDKEGEITKILSNAKIDPPPEEDDIEEEIIEVPNTRLSRNYFIPILAVILLLSGVIILIHDKKKK